MARTKQTSRKKKQTTKIAPKSDKEVESEEENDAEMEETNEEIEVEEHWTVPKYLFCRFCSGLRKSWLKTKCCSARTCTTCALKQVANLKKCWDKECEAPATSDTLENDEQQKRNVNNWHAMTKRWDEKVKTGKILNCTICGKICHRGVTTGCCGVVACRGCAVKKITADRKCWNMHCKVRDITTEKLVNDEVLRKAVDYYKEKGVVDISHAKKISNKQSQLRKAQKPPRTQKAIMRAKLKKERKAKEKADRKMEREAKEKEHIKINIK